MHLLITGSRGQLGRALRSHFSPSHQVTLWSRPTHDIADPACADAVADLAPDLVINAAAWTHVDGAESAVDAAFAANALGPKYLAEGCVRCGAALVQISSNEVFAGEAGCCYREYDEPGPKTVYARSKAAGERAARQMLDRLYIVRLAWLYAPGGGNFPSKIVAAADKQGSLRVVADEYGNPTYAPDVAAALERLIETKRYGIYHLVNEGCASRYDWAAELLRLTGRGEIPLTPIPAHEWPRPAMPPPHAVLINQAAAALGIRLRPWQEALAEYCATENL
ncbi:MAG: dTDP-4-dehydrorhamnose reductase [Chloroflexi bacterium]|nr:MAG: dTDP-4-dehydrorhamnose reductase [Chloroflexota bacterium]